jgi:hypothetical protein
MNLTNKSCAPVLLGVREGFSPSAFKLSRPSRVGPGLEAGGGVSSSTRKKVHAKSLGTWFWVGTLIIIVPFGLAIWLARKLYLTLKEKFDERCEGTVL